MRSVLVAAVASALVAASLAGSSGAQRAASLSWSDPSWSPDGKRIALVSHSNDPPRKGFLYVMRPDGKGLHQVTSAVENPGWPTWSPDSRKIAFEDGQGGIDLVRVDGSGLRMLVATGWDPEWSPRGRRIAYAAADDELSPGFIYAVKPDGTDEQVVYNRVDGYHSYFSPTWSPNGQRLAFGAGVVADCCFDPRRHWIGIVGAYRARPRIYARGLNPFALAWGPRGRQIVFSNYNQHMLLLDLRTRRTRSLGPGEHPHWSPDGRMIVFDSKGDVYVMKTNGSDRKRILTGS